MLPHGPRPTTIARSEHRGPRASHGGQGDARGRPRERAAARPKSSGRPRLAAVLAGHERAGHDAGVGRLARRASAPGVSAGRWPASPRGPRGREPDGDQQGHPDREQRRGELGHLDRQATAAPPGFGPAPTADRDRARDDLEDEAAVGAGVDRRRRGPGRTSGRSPRARSPSVLAAGRARRVDERVASGSSGRPSGRSAARRRRSRRRAGPRRTSTFTRGLRIEIDDRAEQREGDERPDDARRR